MLCKTKNESKYTFCQLTFKELGEYTELTHGLSKTECRVFAYIFGRWKAYNAYKNNNCSVSVSQSELREELDTKSKSHTTKILKQLIDKNLIECTQKGCGRTPSKYKVIDKRFAPKNTSKKGH